MFQVVTLLGAWFAISGCARLLADFPSEPVIPFGTATLTSLTTTLQKLSTDSGSIAIDLDAPAPRDATVHLIHSGTALYGVDYKILDALENGDVLFAKGESSKTFTILPLDTSSGDDRTIEISVGNSQDVTTSEFGTTTSSIALNGVLDLNFGSLFNNGLKFSEMPAPYNLVSFSRASVASYYDADGFVKTAESGVPRFNHDPVTGQPLGLLIEAAISNKIASSESFELNWTPNGLQPIGGGSVVDTVETRAPDNSNGAELLLEDSSAASTHLLSQNVASPSNYATEFSVFAKARGRTQIILRAVQASNTANSFSATCNLDGTPMAGSSTGSGSVTGVVLESLKNGWYRCAVRGQPGSGGNTIFSIELADAGTTTYNGDPTKGVYLWGVNAVSTNLVLVHTSYIPNPGPTLVTRANDVANLNDLTSFWGGVKGTILSEFSLVGMPTVSNNVNQALFSLGNTSTDRAIMILRKNSTASTSLLDVRAGGATVTTGSTTISTSTVNQIGVTHRFGLTMDATSWNASFDGTPSFAGAWTSVPGSVSSILLGGYQGVSGFNLKGNLHRFLYRKDVRTTAEIEAWTTSSQEFHTFERTVQFSRSSWSAVESDGPQAFIIALDERSTSPVTVDYVLSGSAAASRYSATATGTLTFAPGETRKTVFITPINDGIAQGSQTLTMSLSNATGARLSTAPVSTLTLSD